MWSRYVKRVPAYIVALFAGTVPRPWRSGSTSRPSDRASAAFRRACRTFMCRRFSPELILTLLSPAFTVAMLGAIESLLSAVVADRMGGDRHNPNTELFAQGVANIVSPLFGGLPATGALARTATNIRSGARSPVAGMIHALTLLAVLLFGARLAAYVPLPVLAAILFVVAWNMGEWREIPEILKQTYADVLVWLATFLLTVLADLDGRGRGRHGDGGAAVHPPRHAHDDGVARDAGIHRGRAAARPAGQDHSRLRRDLPHPRSVPVWIDRQAARHRAAGGDAAAGRDPALRNMTAVDGTGLSAIEELAEDLRAKETDAGDLRRAGAAGRRDAEGGVSRAARRSEHLHQRAGGARPRRRDYFDATNMISTRPSAPTSPVFTVARAGKSLLITDR